MILCAFSVVGFVFAEPITDLVAGSSPLAAKIAAFSFRAQLVVFPLMAWTTMCNMMLQTMEQTFRATLVAMLRQGIAFIPCVLLLPLCFGDPLLGIQFAQPVADVISFAISIPIGVVALKEMQTSQE